MHNVIGTISSNGQAFSAEVRIDGVTMILDDLKHELTHKEWQRNLQDKLITLAENQQ